MPAGRHGDVCHLSAQGAASLRQLGASDLCIMATLKRAHLNLLAGRARISTTDVVTGMTTLKQPWTGLVAHGQLVLWVIGMAPVQASIQSVSHQAALPFQDCLHSLQIQSIMATSWQNRTKLSGLWMLLPIPVGTVVPCVPCVPEAVLPFQLGLKCDSNKGLAAER